MTNRWHTDPRTCSHSNDDICPTCDFDGYYAATYPDCPWREDQVPSHCMSATAPQDPALWAQWEARSEAGEHRRSPRRVTADGRWQRWCSCGWHGPICDTASEARQSHGVHLINLDLFPDYRDEWRP